MDNDSTVQDIKSSIPQAVAVSKDADRRYQNVCAALDGFKGKDWDWDEPLPEEVAEHFQGLRK